MPFDGISYTIPDTLEHWSTELKSKLPDKQKIREILSKLQTTLRNPDTWPQGFTWDYRSPSNCALGLMMLSHDEIAAHDEIAGWHYLRLANSMPTEDCKNIFFRQTAKPSGFFRRIFSPASQKHVRPEQVADAIGKYLIETA